MNQPIQALLTVKQAAERLSLSPASIYEMIKCGRLPAVRLGRRQGAIRIRPDDLDAYLVSSTPEVVSKPATRRKPTPKLKHIRL